MNKIIKLFAVVLFSTFIFGCSNDDSSAINPISLYSLSDPSNIVGLENASDSDFTYSTTTQSASCTKRISGESYTCVFIRTGTGTGILGTWTYTQKNDYTKTVTYNANGTINYVLEKKDGTTTRHTALFSLYKVGEDFYIKISDNSTEYNIKYFISPNYLVGNSTGCAVLP